MAKFAQVLWTGMPAGDSQKQLEAAVVLWLRTLGTPAENELGLANLIRLFVAPTNSLYFAEGIPKLPRTVTSTGVMVPHIPGINLLWTSEANAVNRWVTLEYLKYVSQDVRINLSWLEYALAKAIGSLYNSGVDWTSKFKKVETIAGIEKVDWL